VGNSNCSKSGYFDFNDSNAGYDNHNNNFHIDADKYDIDYIDKNDYDDFNSNKDGNHDDNDNKLDSLCSDYNHNHNYVDSIHIDNYNNLDNDGNGNNHSYHYGNGNNYHSVVTLGKIKIAVVPGVKSIGLSQRIPRGNASESRVIHSGSVF
jgi:hypothetical protein